MKNQKNNKWVLTLLLMFTILTFILGDYILYYKFFSKTNDKISDKNSSKIVEDKKYKEYKEYKVLSDNDKAYLVIKDNENYKVVSDLGDNIHYIGIYNNKLYFSDSTIKYIDLTDPNLTKNIWLEIPQPDCSDNTEICPSVNICDSKISGNNLYFNTCSFAAGGDDLDGLLSINMNSSKFSNFKKISSLAEEWFVDEKGENVYYMNFYRDDNTVYKYNIESNNSEKLFNTTSYFDHIDYISNNIIYYNEVKDELSLFNVTSRTSTILANNLSEVTGYNNSMWGISSVVGKNLYYYDGKGTIMKYNSKNGNKTSYYKIEDTFYYRGYTFYDDNNFEITYDCYKYSGNTKGHTCTKTHDYISENKVVESLPSKKVIMLDGSSKNFTIDNFQ